MRPGILAAAFSFCLPGLGQLFEKRYLFCVLFFGAFLYLVFSPTGFLWFSVLAVLSSWDAYRDKAEPQEKAKINLGLYFILAVMGLFSWTGATIARMYRLPTAFFILLLCLSLPAAEEDLGGGPSVKFNTYEVASGKVGFLLPHPFKMITGVATEVTGQLIGNPDHWDYGARVDLNITLLSLQSQDARSVPAILGALQTSEYPRIHFESTRATVKTFGQGARAMNTMEFEGTLTIKNISNPAKITVDCIGAIELSCLFKHEIKITDFGIAPPLKFLVSGNDTAAIEGSLLFKSKMKED